MFPEHQSHYLMQNNRGILHSKMNAYFGGNLSMQSSADGMSRISGGEMPYGANIATSKFKESFPMYQALSDATSNNDMMHDGGQS